CCRTICNGYCYWLGVWPDGWNWCSYWLLSGISELYRNGQDDRRQRLQCSGLALQKSRLCWTDMDRESGFYRCIPVERPTILKHWRKGSYSCAGNAVSIK